MFNLHKLQLFNESGKFMFKLFILSLYFLIFPKMAFANNSIIVNRLHQLIILVFMSIFFH